MVASPHQCLHIVGHQTAQKEIQAAYDSGRMPHAWLFVGPEGIGKASVAYHVAHMLLSGGASRLGRLNPESESARLIVAESHPDFFVLRRTPDEKTGVMREAIAVEEARKIAPFLQLTASHGHGRVVLIDEAHRLGRNGQNAILKLIEEPPPGTVILMTATSIGSLLRTIRSRCRIVPFEPLKAGEMEAVLMGLDLTIPSGSEKERLLDLAEGSVGQAVHMIEAEVLPLYEEAMALIAQMPALDFARLHKLGDAIGKKANQESFDVLSGLLVETLRRAVRAAASGQGDPSGLAARLAPAGRLDNALEVWEKTRERFALADAVYLDNKLAFTTAMTALARAMA